MNYTDADALCRRGGKADGEKVDARTIANNTRIIRCNAHLPCGGGEHFHVKLHDTNILTYWADGRVSYDSGGWLTMTTKERMNRFGPDSLTITSDYEHRSGRWLISLDGTTTPFVDGITLRRALDFWVVEHGTALSPAEKDREDRHNKQVSKLIKRYLDHMPSAAGMVNIAGDVDDAGLPIGPCSLCLVTTNVKRTAATVKPARPASKVIEFALIGDGMGDVQHLIEHMIELHYHKGLVLAALTYCGYPDPVLIASMDRDNRFVQRSLRKYLRARLTVGAVATAHGRRPIGAKPWNLTAAMAG